MEQAWIIMGKTYLLTIVISLFVAFLIHMMTLLIRRFGTAAKPLPVSAEQVEISAQPDDPDKLAALAMSAATRKTLRADLQILTDFRRTGSRSDVFSDCQNRNRPFLQWYFFVIAQIYKNISVEAIPVHKNISKFLRKNFFIGEQR